MVDKSRVLYIADFHVSPSTQAVVGRSKMLHNVSICPSQPVAAVGDSEGVALLYQTYITGFQGVVHCLKLSPNLRRGPPEPDRRGEEDSVR